MPLYAGASSQIYTCNVRDYGAAGDGVTDDTAALNACIAAINAAPRGGCMWLPPGVYLISAPLSVLGSEMSMLGPDDGSAVILTSPTKFLTGDVITLPAGGDAVVIQGITIFSSVARTSGAGINTNGCNDFTLRDFAINNMFNGVYVNGGGIKNRIYNGQINNSGATNGCGVLIVNGLAGDTYLRGVVMSNSTQPLAGIRIQQTGHTSILECNVTGALCGLQVDPQANQTVNYVFVTHALFDSNTNYGAYFNAQAATAKVQSVKCTNAWFSGTNAGPGLATNGASGILDDIELTSCRVLNNGTHGVQHAYGNNLSIAGGSIAGNSQQSSNASDGVNVAANLSNWRVEKVTIGTAGAAQIATQRYGVNVLAGAGNNYFIRDNNLTGNVTGPMLDNGTGQFRTTAPNAGALPHGAVSVLGATPISITTTTETQLTGYTLPAGALQVGTQLRFTARAIVTVGALTSAGVYARVRVGPASLTGNLACLCSGTSANGGSGKAVLFTAELTIKSIGTSGTALAGASMLADGSNGAVTNVNSTTATAVAVNTTVANVAEFTLQSTSTTTTFSVYEAFMEVLR